MEQSTPIAKTQPRSPSMTEQQHLDANPAQFSNGSFGHLFRLKKKVEKLCRPPTISGAQHYIPLGSTTWFPAQTH